MIATGSGQRTRRWATGSEPRMVYGPFARAGDWWYAGRDARRRLPDAPYAAAGLDSPTSVARALGTRRMTFLNQRGVGRLEREWLSFRANVVEPLAALRRAQSRRATLAAELASLRERLRTVQRTGLDAPDHAAQRERDIETMRVLLARADVLDAQISCLLETVHHRLRAAQTRAVVIEAYTRRRCASYLERLVRKHPNGRRLDELLAPHWPELSRRGQRQRATPEW